MKAPLVAIRSVAWTQVQPLGHPRPHQPAGETPRLGGGCNKLIPWALVSYLPTGKVTIRVTEQTSAVLPVGSLGPGTGGVVTAALGS